MRAYSYDVLLKGESAGSLKRKSKSKTKQTKWVKTPDDDVMDAHANNMAIFAIGSD